MGGSKTTQTTTVPPPTAAELQKQQIDLQLAQTQLRAIQQQEALQGQLQPLFLQEAGLVPTYGTAPTPERLAAIDYEINGLRLDSQAAQRDQGFRTPSANQERIAGNQQRIDALLAERAAGGTMTGYAKSPERIAQEKAAQAQADRANTLQMEMLEAEAARIKQGTAATPEQKALIAQSTEAAIASGEADIKRFGEEFAQVLTKEFSQAAGLRPTDTPIQDRGARAAAAATDQQGRLVTALRGAQAEAELNFPLAASRIQSAATGQQQELLLRTQDFQNALRQQSFQNRFDASGFQGGLGIASAAANNNFTVFPKGYTTTEKKSGGGSLGPILSGVGAVLAPFTGGLSLAATTGINAAVQGGNLPFR